MGSLHKSVILQAIEEYLLGHDQDGFRGLYDADCLGGGPDIVGDGAAGNTSASWTALRDHSLLYKSTFPDMVFHVDEIIEEGDRVAARWTVRGPDCGNGDARKVREMLKLPEEQFSVSGVLFCRIRAGKIVEFWQLSELLTLAKCMAMSQMKAAGAD